MKKGIKKIGALLLAGLLLVQGTAYAEDAASTGETDTEQGAVSEQTGEKTPGKTYSNGIYEYEVLPDGKSVQLGVLEKDIIPGSSKLILPREIDGMPVKEVKWILSVLEVNDLRRAPIDVVIPDGVEIIKSFNKDSLLRSLDIGKDVREIENSAFVACKNLKRVTGGEGVQIIGSHAFSGCKSLTSMPEFWKNKFQNSHRIGYDLFSASGIKSVTYNKYLDQVAVRMFEGCKGLKRVTLTKQHTIMFRAFENCKSLKKVKFCNGLEYISYCAFKWCEKLEEAKLPNSVEEMGLKAFQHCRSMKKVTLPKSLTYLGPQTFQDCRSLKEIKIPKSLKKIEFKTFQGCKNLKKAVIPKTVKSIQKTAFSGCKRLVIYCPKGSYAHKFAKKNHIKYHLQK